MTVSDVVRWLYTIDHPEGTMGEYEQVNSALKLMKFVLKLMNSALKLMDFAFK